MNEIYGSRLGVDWRIDFCSFLGGDTILNMSGHEFTQMQGDLDQQRLLGDRPLFPSMVDQILAKEIHHKER